MRLKTRNFGAESRVYRLYFRETVGRARGGSRGSLRQFGQAPDGLEFPPDLKDRIHFDPDARKLIFHGYMSKTDFDRLCQLTNGLGLSPPPGRTVSSVHTGRTIAPEGSRSIASRRHTTIYAGLSD